MLTPDTIGYALGIVALICLILPPKWDPAIRWKERREQAETETSAGVTRAEEAMEVKNGE